jgi:hypothetical protein
MTKIPRTASATMDDGDQGGPAGRAKQDELYRQVASEFGTAMDRLARAYELDLVRRNRLW